ncbi:serine hydrolase domain-containing protein [Paenibacillus hodogayensis]|uniref:Serine hydrolase domain-containing protein n=1 Tax=Paenibacillus hodogayensis TaxID=279208 RepID=A0ABV5VVC8_9BACL
METDLQAKRRSAVVLLLSMLCPLLLVLTACSGDEGKVAEKMSEAANVTANVNQNQNNGNAQQDEWKRQADLYLEKNSFNGAVLVARKGEVLFSKGYGKATESAANTPDTVFRIMSLSKAFTAAAILQLQEKNLLQVTDTLDKYVPDFKNGSTITIHHLLSHSSGIPREFPRMLNVPIKETIDAIKSRDLEFAPGTKYSYSNSGYIILAYIIATVSGQSYKQYMEDHIFGPLNMTKSGESIVPEDKKEPMSTGYVKNGNAVTPAPYFVTQSGGGSLYSTVGDLLLWDRALYGETVLKQSSITKLFAPNLDNYGYGWSYRPKKGNVVVHNGSGSGYSTFIYRKLDSQDLVVVLSNVSDVPAEQIGFELAGKMPHN